MIRLLCGYVLITHSALSQPSAKPHQDTVLSVCEILDNLQKYDGRVVAVRGEIVLGPEQSFLQPFGCSVTTEFAKQNTQAIWATPPGNWFPTRKVPYVANTKSQEAFRKFWDDIERQGKGGSILVTITGMIDAARTLRPAEFKLIRYGQFGKFPAMIIVKDLIDPEFVPREPVSPAVRK